MVKGYQTEDIKQRLLVVLKNSKIGISGSEISERLGVNRVTMTKYLGIFAAEGLIRQKNIGNTNLWFVEEGTEQFHLPEDYYLIKTKFLEYLLASTEFSAYNLIRNCLHSNEKISKTITEIIIPAIESIQNSSQQGKIGKSEERYIAKIISNCIHMIYLAGLETNPKKNVVVISADSLNVLKAEAASASYRSDGWTVFSLGDMSSMIDVMFDLDLQKFLSQIWKQKNGIMVIIVFSSNEKSSKFFSEAVNSFKTKYGKKMYLVLCGKTKKTTKIDLVTEDFKTALQWSETIFQSQMA